MESCTFHKKKNYAVSAEKNDIDYTVNIVNSILSVDRSYISNYRAQNLVKTEGGIQANVQDCLLFVTDDTGEDPLYQNDFETWENDPPDAFNSSAFPNMGYSTEATVVQQEVEKAPHAFALYSNYPNPFNPSTTIVYQLDQSRHVTLSIHDIQGRMVETLIDDFQNSGIYKIKFDGRHLPSGVYIYHLSTPTQFSSRKMVLVQ